MSNMASTSVLLWFWLHK